MGGKEKEDTCSIAVKKTEDISRDNLSSWLSLTFLRRVLIINSLARWGAGWGSRGRITILLSKGSPGTIWNVRNILSENLCWPTHIDTIHPKNIHVEILLHECRHSGGFPKKSSMVICIDFERTIRSYVMALSQLPTQAISKHHNLCEVRIQVCTSWVTECLHAS